MKLGYRMGHYLVPLYNSYCSSAVWKTLMLSGTVEYLYGVSSKNVIRVGEYGLGCWAFVNTARNHFEDHKNVRMF
jgi:hypothetical protein